MENRVRARDRKPNPKINDLRRGGDASFNAPLPHHPRQDDDGYRMEDSELGAGFVPRIRNPALLRLSAAVLAVSLAGCPGVQISQKTDSAPSGAVATPAPVAAPAEAPSMSSALLSWEAPTGNEDGTPITGLAGYRIHFGLSAAELDQFIDVTDPASTTYSVKGLTSGTYYFAVSAYNSFGIEGPLSNIASKSF
jgi:hypothetical protein